MKNDTTGLSRREFLGVAAVTAISVAYPISSQGEGFHSSSDPKLPSGHTLLQAGWMLQSSAVVTDKGSAISSSTFTPNKWYPVTVPSTVLAGLVATGEYPDIFFGDNLSKVPADRFATSWWYRKEFAYDSPMPGQRAWLYFKGINYRANIWLNGTLLTASDKAVGTYRDFEFDVTHHVSAKNVLAIEVFRPDPEKDLAITFVDWAPAPPDQNMGIWQDLELRTSGPVTVRNPFVLTDLSLPSRSSARLTVMADLTNTTNASLTGTLSGTIGDIHFSTTVTLEAGKTQTVSFTPEAFAQLAINQPRVWWPWQLGEPSMYELVLVFETSGQVSDKTVLNFGIRSITSRLENKHRLFTINGVDILILGGGYAPDLLQRREGQEAHVRYMKDMNLNTVRLEGKLEDDAFYDLCDKHGILVMAGWCCCSPWEKWKNWKEEQHTVAMDSLRYQIRRARTHPSLLAWLNGSDNHPTAAIEAEYLQIEKDLHWPNPTISSATTKKAAMSEPTGVKMEGPYDWVPPIFWMTDTKTGGAWGFNTEVGPGPVPPPLESLEQMFPVENRWPINKVWDAHCGRGVFGNINNFAHALDERFGKSKNIADFAWKAQAQAYETIRAMYEAFRRNKFNATGQIQWMLNNAWPSLIWHLYDYYMRPGAAYFATKLGCEPLHILYSYDNHSIVVANDSMVDANNLTVSANVYNIDSNLKHHQTATLSSRANSSTPVFTLPTIADLSSSYFVRLTLQNSTKQTISVNSYWLSTKPEVLATNDGPDSWYLTPVASFTDYSALQQLPKVTLTLGEFVTRSSDSETIASVKVTNTSEAVALLVRLKLTRGTDGDELLPIRWEDNYFMLLPNESRTVSARYLTADVSGKAPTVSVDCFNNGRAI